MLKKAWLNEHADGLNTLTLESSSVFPAHQRLSVHENTFPAVQPQHHVMVIGLLNDDDLKGIQTVISDYLGKR